MDRKSLIILVAAVLLLMGLSPLVDHFFPPKEVPIPAEVTNAAPGHLQTNAALASNGVLTAAPAYSAPAATPSPSSPERILTVSNEDLVVRFTSRGGGLKTVSLKKYPAIISRTDETSIDTNMATLNTGAPNPVLDLLSPELQGDNEFNLSQNGQTVTAEKTLPNGLRVVKEFTLGTNYLFTARVLVENTSAKALTIPEREVVIGTATPIGPLDDPTTLGAFWYDGLKAQKVDQAWFANRTLGCFPGTPRALYEEGTNNVVWAAVHNQFFTLAAIPDNAAPRLYIRKVSLPLPAMVGLTNATSGSLTNGFETTLWYPSAVLPARQMLAGKFTFYAGPKENDRLAEHNLVRIMDFGKFTGFFSEGLLTAMNILHKIGLGYGWTIIAITVIIKIIFWPLTRASTKSQKRMQLLQPQMKAIAEKYKDDPVKKNQKTMDFMKEHKVSPLGSCLPTMIQIPVFFGFYYMLRNAIELRGVHFLWAHDLSQPDTIAYLPILGGFPINPLPLIMGATQLWQAQLLPPSPGMDPGQQKMMRYMPLMFIAMLYRMSAGLTLYWTISNLLSILQTKITSTVDATAPGPGGAVAKKKK